MKTFKSDTAALGLDYFFGLERQLDYKLTDLRTYQEPYQIEKYNKKELVLYTYGEGDISQIDFDNLEEMQTELNRRRTFYRQYK